ncbi:RCC1 domain-containing protein [Labilithrix luteola]|nr:hypothetical protein [Labilithrix luteola]
MRRLPILFTGALLASGVLFVVACSDSSDGPSAHAFDEDSGASDDSSVANLPPPSHDPVDSGADVTTTPDASKDAAPPNYDASDEAVACVDGAPCAVKLAAGERHVCALINDGTVRCWGDNTKGAVGMPIVDAGTDPDAAPPVVDAGVTSGIAPRTVANITNATQLSAADDNTCVRLADGTVQCWGKNDTGQLGLQISPPKTDSTAHPAANVVPLTGAATRVDVGHGAVCAVMDSGELWCWGQNAQGQMLRRGAPTIAGPGGATLGGLDVREAVASNTTIYAKATDGALYSWGLVSGRITSYLLDPVPRAMDPFSSVVDFAVSSAQVDSASGKGRFHTCAIAEGQVYCWGVKIAGDMPALCSGTPNDSVVPVLAPVAPAETEKTAYPQQLAVARYNTCVRLTDGTIQCCGDDSLGQMGAGTPAPNPAVLNFTKASALQGYAVQVVTSQFAVCALLKNGSVSCWGGNKYGELGQGTVDSKPHATPVKVF